MINNLLDLGWKGIVDVVRQSSEEKWLSMNVKKTTVVCRDETPDVRIVVNGQVLEQVIKFKYLGKGLETMVDANVRLRTE